MKKYAIDINYNWKGSYDAGPKARIDVSRTLKNKGYRIVCIKNREFKSKKLFSLCRKLQIIWLYLRFLRKADIVLFQFPGVISLWLLGKLRKNNTKITILIHDLENIRGERSFTEKSVLDFADNIISHTPRMTEFLRQNGVSAKIHIINLFDYYINGNSVLHTTSTNSVAFCGNLSKSPFIAMLDNIQLDYKIYLYGNGLTKEITNKSVEHLGAFNSNEVSNIRGEWGLVWDGDSVYGCETSAIGRYLRYNSSHKSSLYIVAEKPLIVWKEAAIAEFVEKMGIGITVSSLLDIGPAIKSITQEQYKTYMANIMSLKEKLTKGEILSQVIAEIENE